MTLLDAGNWKELPFNLQRNTTFGSTNRTLIVWSGGRNDALKLKSGKWN